MKLPEEFLQRVKGQLGDSYEDFLASYEKGRTYGLRYNPLKVNKESFEELMAKERLPIFPVEWAGEGYYYEPESKPGMHPLHEAGAYYIQEPSAMAVAELLAPEPGERICDLCAAPGGKSTQIAGRMLGDGILVSNEPIPSRARILSQNIERLGVANAIVCCEAPQRLAELYGGYFDRILVDAPCSGEGMFRKNEDACGEWSPAQVVRCADRQREILSSAVEMLRPGGILVYSTCTFAPQENEENARWLVSRYPWLRLDREVHIWPHLQRGEGHYAARFMSEGMGSAEGKPEGDETDIQYGIHALNDTANHLVQKRAARQKSSLRGASAVPDESAELLKAFFKATLTREEARRYNDLILTERLLLSGTQVYLLPSGGRSFLMPGLKLERPGLHLGVIKKDRFEPAHSFAMSLHPSQVQRVAECELPQRYLHGETLDCDKEDGWALVTTHGISMGWGKVSHGILKNHYPKGLRK